MTNFRSLFLSHDHAERLIDDEIDAARGEGIFNDADRQWLDEHLGACARCRAAQEERRMLMAFIEEAPAEVAPEGFAGRVMMAAKARGRDEVGSPAFEAAPPMFGRRFAFGGLALAMVLGLFVYVGANQQMTGSSGVHVSGHATDGIDQPHFSVRAPGVGAAQVRAQISTIVKDHDGDLITAGRDVLVRIPRAELIGVMQDLARRGRFKVTKADAGEVGPDVETIVIRFELD